MFSFVFTNCTPFAGGTKASGCFFVSLLAFAFGVFAGFVFVFGLSFGFGVLVITGRSLRASNRGLMIKKNSAVAPPPPNNSTTTSPTRIHGSADLFFGGAAGWGNGCEVGWAG